MLKNLSWYTDFLLAINSINHRAFSFIETQEKYWAVYVFLTSEIRLLPEIAFFVSLALGKTAMMLQIYIFLNVLT